MPQSQSESIPQSWQLLHRGSVKDVYQTGQPDCLCFAYTDDYSVFDWGKMPDAIPGKGHALASLGAYFFAQLEDPASWERLGLSRQAELAPQLPIAHHLMRSEGSRLFVRRVAVPPLPSASVAGQLIYEYKHTTQGARRLLPLEVLFRLGVPAGSSLLKRKDWYPFPIAEGMEFQQPLIEFSTKLETSDRVIPYQEAALILQDTGLLAQLHAKTYACALFLQALLAECGLKLLDGKLEWAWVDGALQLVDSIGPDELRVSQEGVVFSKQFLRNFYQGSSWEAAIAKGQGLARERGQADWVRIVREELGEEPPPLSPACREAAQALYADFHTLVVERKPSTRFLQARQRL